MKIFELKNTIKKDSLIHYINKYECTVEYEADESTHTATILVILEKTALGTTTIQFDNLDDKLKNNIESLRNFIDEQNKKGLFV
ncbi:MAG: hypothetical protein PQJ61_14780 [Spirochaetales bacterium]|uniref:Uncharacterized protein n=1 Tax=Candidatus Thalassospirochaeta sargassi TaxID=3119039 RepID=A0AAJ1IEY5_9SPIO|nr:hypothetical protein [Spirochaetales bacterium]